MDVVTLIAAAETAGEEDRSDTLFIIAGLLLAGWAVLVAAYGIRRHREWPTDKGPRQAIVAVTALLVAATCASAALGL